MKKLHVEIYTSENHIRDEQTSMFVSREIDPQTAADIQCVLTSYLIRLGFLSPTEAEKI